MSHTKSPLSSWESPLLISKHLVNCVPSFEKPIQYSPCPRWKDEMIWKTYDHKNRKALKSEPIVLHLGQQSRDGSRIKFVEFLAVFPVHLSDLARWASNEPWHITFKEGNSRTSVVALKCDLRSRLAEKRVRSSRRTLRSRLLTLARQKFKA